jgi:hypothetical protein
MIHAFYALRGQFRAKNLAQKRHTRLINSLHRPGRQISPRARSQVCGKSVSVERVRSSLVILPPALFIISLGAGWLRNLLAIVGILAVLLAVCALLYVYWVPRTPEPVRDADGNPRFR